MLYHEDKLLESMRKEFKEDSNASQQYILARCAERGFVRCLALAIEFGLKIEMWVCEKAAKYGRIDSLQYLKGHVQFDENVCAAAALGGQLSCLKWLREQGCPWDIRVYIFACQSESYDCFYWALNQGCPTENIVNLHMKRYYVLGDLFPSEPYWKSYAYLRDEDSLLKCFQCCRNVVGLGVGEPDHYGVGQMIQYRAMKIVRYMIEELKIVCAVWLCPIAINCKNIPAFYYLHEKGCPLSSECFEAALYVKDKDLVHYLIYHKCPMNDRTMEKAAEWGDLEIIELLHMYGCPLVHSDMDYWIMPMLAKGCHVEAFDFLASVCGCEWNALWCMTKVYGEDDLNPYTEKHLNMHMYILQNKYEDVMKWDKWVKYRDRITLQAIRTADAWVVAALWDACWECNRLRSERITDEFITTYGYRMDEVYHLITGQYEKVDWEDESLLQFPPALQIMRARAVLTRWVRWWRKKNKK